MATATPDYVKELARELRNRQTPAEDVLWRHLRSKQLDRFKFYRQYPIYRYIADCYCPERKLVIELDGGIHDDRLQKEKEEIRQEDIEDREIRVIRFRNDQVFQNLEQVLQEISYNLSKVRLDKISTRTI